MRAAYHVQTMGEPIDKTKGKMSDLTGNERLKREGRTQSQVEGTVKYAKHAVDRGIRN